MAIGSEDMLLLIVLSIAGFLAGIVVTVILQNYNRLVRESVKEGSK